ncbi:conserved oligomeric Golgi complex subunit 1 [Galendromus occidentalis]|uniref:Conserved oligomeric Golgi complex subunit 1 n=1 Tax=Galendromus occidentalis TaxID=34638 RepID=A0AAJ6QW73_9ACAR|nr:conserved oligomeric Golgi complex subunit 1 [Galendromus occidentalis]
MIPNEDSVSTGADALFQQHSIAEIVEIRQRILQDITKKNHEVRELVGERYRDLIDAADTIQNMKRVVDELPAKLQQLPLSCGEFNPCPLEVPSRDAQVFTNFAQTKLILDICAKLGALIEAREMISSAALIALAQVALRDNNLPAEVLSSTQKSLKNSTRLLNKACLAAVADPVCDKDALAETLCTLSILEGRKPERLVETFFQERRARLDEILDSQMMLTKDKFSAIAQYLIKTLSLSECLSSDRPYFLEYFERHRISTEGIVSLVEDPLSLSTHFLAQYLSEFRCILPKSLYEAKLTSLTREKTKSFIEDIRQSCRQKLALELQCFSDCRAIAKTYDHLVKSIEEIQLSTVCINGTPNVYELFFRDAIVRRIAEIFEDIISKATEQMLVSVHASFAEASRIKSSNVPTLCRNLDAAVKSALDQLAEFAPYGEVTSDEYRSLAELTSTATEQKLTQVRAFVSQCVESGVRCCYFLSLLSHLSASLTACTNLQKVFGSTWTQRRDFLMESRDLAASTAMNVLVDEAMGTFRKAFEETPVNRILLEMSSVKARIEMSEEGESGLQSTSIHVPQHCLFPLSQLLFSISVYIRDRMECAVSVKVVAQINLTIAKAVEDTYQKVLDSRACLPQTAQQELAVQLLFDMEYLEKLLSSSLDDDFRSQCIALIDPVDYHMARPHLDEGVIGLVAQTAMLYGLLCPRCTPGKPRKQTSQDHNVVPLAEQTIQRFSSLPVGVPSLRR